MPIDSNNSLYSELQDAWNNTTTAVDEILGFSVKKDPATITKEVFIEEIPTPKHCNFEDTCSIEELMHRVMMYQAYFCRRVQESLERTRPTLMQLYTGENQKQCGTYATWGAKSWKYLGAVLQVAGAVVPFSGAITSDTAKLASQGLSGTGAASGGVGNIWDEHYSGLRTGYQHTEGNMRKLVENNDRSSTNAYSSIEVLARLISDIANKMHQSKTEMVR
jgi:hypothetical protein